MKLCARCGGCGGAGGAEGDEKARHRLGGLIAKVIGGKLKIAVPNKEVGQQPVWRGGAVGRGCETTRGRRSGADGAWEREGVYLSGEPNPRTPLGLCATPGQA